MKGHGIGDDKEFTVAKGTLECRKGRRGQMLKSLDLVSIDSARRENWGVRGREGT